MGLSIYGEKATKMPTVTPIFIPEGVDGEAVREEMLHSFGVEIASSFGDLKGKIWRIGNMGYSSRKENILHVLAALEGALLYQQAPISAGKALIAALNYYEKTT